MQTFRSMDEYVRYVTTGKIVPGEVFCLSFIPSAFFPKEVVQYFFERKDAINSYRELASRLSTFGRQVIGALERKEIRIAIEYSALKTFVDTGVVHKAKPNFQATVPTRLHVLEHILAWLDNIYILSEPAPFTFRLTPPNRVVIDVDSNVTSQTIQGLAFCDLQAFGAFSEEFERLAVSSRVFFPVASMADTIARTRDAFLRGAPAQFLRQV